MNIEVQVGDLVVQKQKGGPQWNSCSSPNTQLNQFTQWTSQQPATGAYITFIARAFFAETHSFGYRAVASVDVLLSKGYRWDVMECWRLCDATYRYFFPLRIILWVLIACFLILICVSK
jgi:hypothetical protein